MTPLADFGDVLGSPVWTVLATLLAGVAIAVTVILYRRQRSRKSLSYEINVTRLVSVHSAAKDRIRIYYDDEQIEQAQLVEVRISNSGNVPILASEFEQPLSLRFGDRAAPLTAEVSSSAPAELGAEVFIQEHAVTLRPLLLNPGDELTLKIFVRNLMGRVVCQSRIVGVSHLTDAGREVQRSPLAQFMAEPIIASLIAILTTIVALILFLSTGTLGRLVDSEPSRPASVNTLFVLDNGQRVCADSYQPRFGRLRMIDTQGRYWSISRRRISRFVSNGC